MPSLRAERLTFAWADTAPILDGAGLHLQSGWTALVGENGAGKTTLLRLLAGELAPAAGRVWRDPPGATLAHCPQEVTAPDGDLGAFAAAGDGEAHALRGRLQLAAGDLARWPSLSPGERKRWHLGAALHRGPAMLLLDEPTNHVDAAARALLAFGLGLRAWGLVLDEPTNHLDLPSMERLEAALQAYPSALLLVTHDDAFATRLTSVTWRIASGGIQAG